MKTQWIFCLGVFTAIVATAVGLKWQYQSFAETDPHVVIDQRQLRSGAPPLDPHQVSVLDGEVARQSERLRDLCDLGIVASDFLITSVAKGRRPGSVDEFLEALSRDSVYRVGPGNFVSGTHTLMMIRYRAEPPAIEILSLPKEDLDGPAMLIRLPDEESTVGARLFQSRTLGTRIWYPPPFSPYAAMLAGSGIDPGWTEERIRLIQTPQSQADSLTRPVTLYPSGTNQLRGGIKNVIP